MPPTQTQSPTYYRQNGAYYTLEGGRPRFVSDAQTFRGLRSGQIRSEEGTYFSTPQRSQPITNQTTPIESPTQMPTPASVTAPTFPTPTAPTTEEGYVQSLTEQSANLRKKLEDTYKTQKADVDKRLENLEIERQGFLSKMDPTTRSTYDQELRVMQNQLDASEAASKTIQTNFEEKQRLVGELEKLLTEGNMAIAKQKTAPVAQRVLNTRVNNTIQDVAARTGVIEAVLTARDGQILQAHNIINQAANTVKANWNEQLQYYNTLLEYNNKGIISLEKEQKELAEKQVGLVEYDLGRVDKTVDYLQKLMVDPDTAQFIADAGVKLTDTVEEVNAKMSAQAKIKEVADFKKELLLKGYEFSPTATAGTKAFNVGGQTLYFKPPVKETTSLGYTAQELRKLRAAGIDSKNIEEADKFLYGNKGSQFTLSQLNKGASLYGSIEEFNDISDDAKNIFINRQTELNNAVKNMISAINKKETTIKEQRTLINDSDSPQEVKNWLLKKLDALDTEKSESWWSKVKSFFGY